MDSELESELFMQNERVEPRSYDLGYESMPSNERESFETDFVDVPELEVSPRVSLL